VESTYGVQAHSSQLERELRFTTAVESTVRQGGNCLIPVFALGRAQELLLILDSYWHERPDLQNIPIFYASRLASKALRVYQTFVNMMNRHISYLTDIGNPFRFNHITNMQKADFDCLDSCVVIASPGMLQNGVSRQLFERWCDDRKSTVILAGYSVEGTLAKKLLQEPEEIVCLDGRTKARKCNIESISFSAHVDYIQNLKFMRAVVPDNIVLEHGERSEMHRLKEELDREVSHSWPSTHKPPVVVPKNGQSVTLRFKKTVRADVLGSVAHHVLHSLDHPGLDGSAGNPSAAAATVEVPRGAVVVTENFNTKVVSAEELVQHTPCRLGRHV